MKLRENFSKDFPCKFTPALVLHVLHFIVDFFYNPRASLARAEFKRDFLDNHGGRRSIAFKTFFDPRYRPPTPVLVDSEVRGTTLQKLIVDSEVRGTTLQKLIVSESEVKVKWKWSESEVKSEKWSEVIFWSLIFFCFQICWRGVLGNNNIGIKSAQQLSYGC